MDEEFNAEEFRRSVYPPDTVLTLSPMMSLGLVFVLLLLCGLCFGVGYSMGSRGAHDSPPTGQQPGAPSASPAAISRSKPAATSQNIPQKPQPAPALPAPTTRTEPAAGKTGALMVQIATVSHQEDADVLVSALRKRGYAVSVSRDAADNQFHVRIGPFSNRNDAEAMRKKLIYDGYNAVVQP
jgi:cell division septation protein DedD